MDFQFTQDQQKFREEIKCFLHKVLPDRESLGPEWGMGFSREFSQRLGERGWIGISWPKEYGGQGRSYMDRTVLLEELYGYGAPGLAHRFGERQIGPAIMRYGNEEQKQEFLPRITKGEVVFCVGMSEPEAGSDLASLNTRAVIDGDRYILSGQKVWTTAAHRADYCYLVARTDATVAKHRGISEFIVDLKWPGIEIRPLLGVTKEHSFNEVFFDNDHVSRRYLIGEENRGWYQIASQLGYERGSIEQIVDVLPFYEALVKFIHDEGLMKNALVRNEMAELAIQFEVGRMLCYRVPWLLDKGILPSHEAGMAKLFASEFKQRLADFCMKILGPYGQLMTGSLACKLKGYAARMYITSRGNTIGAGTSEVLRTMIAVRGLGLPS